VTGLLTQIDNVGELAHSINQVLNDNTLAQSLCKSAWLEYQSHYTRDIITNQYVSFFKQLT